MHCVTNRRCKSFPCSSHSNDNGTHIAVESLTMFEPFNTQMIDIDAALKLSIHDSSVFSPAPPVKIVFYYVI